MNNEIVELNVGGTIYSTSRTTLASYPNSMLACMVSQGALPTALDSMNRIFIDRDGSLFRYILNFLRDKHLSLPTDFTEYSQLYSEADFYQILPIMRQLEELSPKFTCQLSHTNSYNQDKSWSYITVVSKLYKGSIIAVIGSIRVLLNCNFLSVNSQKFVGDLLKSVKGIEKVICEFKFVNDERILSVKYLSGETSCSGIHNAIFRLSKKYAITTEYWDDIFNLTLIDEVPHRDLFYSFLRKEHNATQLSSNVIESQDNTKSTKEKLELLERWCLPKPD